MRRYRFRVRLSHKRWQTGPGGSAEPPPSWIGVIQTAAGAKPLR